MFSQTILSDNANALRLRTDLNLCRLALSLSGCSLSLYPSFTGLLRLGYNGRESQKIVVRPRSLRSIAATGDRNRQSLTAKRTTPGTDGDHTNTRS